jgi:hypothetical protein
MGQGFARHLPISSPFQPNKRCRRRGRPGEARNRRAALRQVNEQRPRARSRRRRSHRRCRRVSGRMGGRRGPRTTNIPVSSSGSMGVYPPRRRRAPPRSRASRSSEDLRFALPSNPRQCSVRRQSNRDHETRFVRDTFQPVGSPMRLVDSSVCVV